MKFEAQIETFTKELGGRHIPFFDNYKAIIALSDNEADGIIHLTDGKEMVSPGETAKVIIELGEGNSVKLEETFMIKDEGNLVGAGKVTKIL